MPDVNKPISARVLELVDVGVPVGDAVRIALAPTRERRDQRTAIPQFAARHERNPKAVAQGIYGHRPAPDWLVEDLAEELGGTPEQWRELLRYGDRLGSDALRPQLAAAS